jgi:L-methionine (R)-S-oxide reductase
MIDNGLAEQTLEEVAASCLAGRELRKFAMERLSRLPGYNWSGIYRLENETLLLDEYVGAETDHAQIAIGVGVCGTAVAEDRNQVIEDVRNLTNYLACSTQTRSEIVVLIRDLEGATLGQIDVDGHQVGAFGASDEGFLTQLAELLAKNWD